MHTTMRNHWRAADSCPNVISRRRVRDTVAIATALVACTVLALHAQPAQAPQLTDTLAAAAAQAEPSGEVSTLTFFNRPIVVLRARVLGRVPRERVTAAEGILRQLVEAGVTGPVAAQTVEGGALITVGFRPVFGLWCRTSIRCRAKRWTRSRRQTVARLQQALDEAGEARRPGAAGASGRAGDRRARGRGARVVGDLPQPAGRGAAAHRPLRENGGEDGRGQRRGAARFARAPGRTAARQRGRVPPRCADPLRRRHVRPPPLPVYPSVGRVDARVSDRHRTITRSQRRERDSRVLHGRADPAARQVVHPARRHLLQCGRTRADRCAAVDACRDGTADPPAAHRGDVAVRHRRGLSVPAGQRYGGVPRRQRLRRPDVHAGVGRHRPARHERLHDHLLAGAAGRRLREDRRGRGNGDAPRHPVDQGADAAARGDHHPERRRHGARRPSTTRGSPRPTA